MDDLQSKIKSRVEKWKTRLLDMGMRNRLLNYRETKRSNLNIVDPDFDVLYKKLLNMEHGKCFTFACPQDIREIDQDDETELSYTPGDIQSNRSLKEEQRTLRVLRNRAKTTIEEQGINTLYMTFGMLHWGEAAFKQDRLAPLILVPVHLSIESITSPFTLTLHDDEIVLNPTIRFKLQNDYGILLPSFDSDTDDLEAYLALVEKVVANTNWSVDKTVTLSLMSFLKINMYEDLNRHLEKLENNAIVKGLCGDDSEIVRLPEGFSTIKHDEIHRPIDIFQVVDADSSQQDAIELMKRNVSFVLQGPPGTGKSQTITNIIAEAMAAGKKVLFVSEKSAALEVVYNRLEKAGLEDFCLNLHSHKTNKKAILDDLAIGLELNPIQLCAETRLHLNQLTHNRSDLNEYDKELHELIEPLEMSIYTAQGKLAALRGVRDVVFKLDNVRETTQDQFDNYNFLIKELLRTLGKMSEDYDTNAWKGANVPQVTHELRHDLENNLHDQITLWIALLERLHEDFMSLGLKEDLTLLNLCQYVELLRHCSKSPMPPLNWTMSSEYSLMLEKAKTWKKEQQLMNFSKKNISPYYSDGIFELQGEQLSNLIGQLFSGLQVLLAGNKTKQYIYEHIDEWIKIGQKTTHILEQTEELGNKVARRFGIRSMATLTEMSCLQQICDNVDQNYKPCKEWFAPGESARCKKILLAVEERYREIDDAKEALQQNYSDNIFKINYRDLKNKYDTDYIPLFNRFKTLKENYEVVVPTTVDELQQINTLCQTVNKNLRISEKWIEMTGLELAEKDLKEVTDKQERLIELQGMINNIYEKKIYDILAEEMMSRFRLQYTSLFKVFKSSYRKDKKLFLSLRKLPASKISDFEMIQVLSQLHEVKELQDWFVNNDQRLSESLGGRFQGAETETEFISRAIENFKSVANLVSVHRNSILIQLMIKGECPEAVLTYIGYFQNEINVRNAMETLQDYQQERKQLLIMFMGIPENMTDEIVLHMLTNVETYHTNKVWLSENEKIIQSKLGSKYNGEKTSFAGLRRDFDLTDELLEMLNSEVPENLSDILEQGLQLEDVHQFQNFIKEQQSVEMINEFTAMLTEQPDDITVIKNKVKDWNSFLAQLRVLLNKFSTYQLVEEQFETLMESLQNLVVYQQKKDQLAQREKELKSTYGHMFVGKDTDWSKVIEALDWTAEFVQMWQMNPNRITVSFLSKICTPAEMHADEAAINLCGELADFIEEKYKQLMPFVEWIDQYFDKDYCVLSMNVFSALDRLERCRDNLAGLEEWIDFRKAHESCKRAGLDDFVQEILKDKIVGQDVADSFYKRFYRLWLDSVFVEHPAVAGFRRSKQDEAVRDFKQLDRDQLTIARIRVKERLINGLPDFNGPTSAHGDVGILLRELGKKRKIMPLRKLFTKIPDLILALKPCLMMSPLTVSLFLQSDAYQFDVVIFDEASQVCTENAIGAILRGNQVIIAGDKEQLPPSNFFMASSSAADDAYDSENEDEDEDDSYESILDEVDFLPERSLKWHYRSRHEELIAFSNSEIYRNELTTFPSVVEKEADIGVEYVYVPEGVYDRGGKKDNKLEAQKVATLVFEHFAKYPKRSLGVITFSEAQRSAVDACIRAVRLANPEFERFFSEESENHFFTKNLENVQGDERDTIIFSIGYAKDLKGTMYMNFGPLSRTGGYRRLNVAITRAKFNIKLVGSIHPTDINLEKVSTDGVIMLRHYIEYAMNGPKSLANRIVSNRIVNTESPFEEAIYDFLCEHNYIVETQVGCSGYRIDMAVKNPKVNGQYAIGIECDGATYHSARTARDRDRLRQDVLEDMGWTIYRIWSTDWVKDPKTEGDRLIQAVEAAINKGQINLMKDKNDRAYKSLATAYVVVTPDKAKVNTTFNFSHYEEADVYSILRKNKDDIFSTIVDVVKKEGSIHGELLYRRLLPAFDRSKVTPKYKDQADCYINQVLQDNKIQQDGDFFLPDFMQTIIPKVPKEGDDPRPIEYIYQEELKGILYEIIQTAIGLSVNECISIASHELGYFHCGTKIKDTLADAIHSLAEVKKVEEIAGKLRIVE